MRKNLRVVAFGALFLGVVASRVEAAAAGTSIEPIIGYERVQTLLPTAHSKDRLIYGARVTAGFILFSLEAEYFHAKSTETFSTPNETVAENADKVRLGVRSTIRLAGILSLIARAGGQASRTIDDVTLNGINTRTTGQIEYHPYGGLGLRAGLGHNVSFSGDITTVFHKFPNMNDNEYQVTAGFAVSFP